MRVPSKSASVVAKAKAKAIRQEAKNSARTARSKAKAIDRKSKSDYVRSKGWRAAASQAVAANVANTANREETKRQVAKAQAQASIDALSKWNSIINQNPIPAEGTGDSTPGQKGNQSTGTWYGNA